MTTPALQLNDLSVTLDRIPIVDHASLGVEAGQIVALLGPSGCGKTTLLRAVAGLVPLREGRVLWNGDDLAAVSPHERGFGLMFQDHVLFPHLDVAGNVGYGLRVARASAAAIRRRVDELLDLVGLPGMGARRVDSLSGGEAQRVALARALAPAPRLLMLDEPLGSLDLDLRRRLTAEIRELLNRLGLTALHVTHDQDEAFAIADRVAIMHRGAIDRVDTAENLWRDPRSERVARFLGHLNIAQWPGRGKVVVRPDAIALAGSPGSTRLEGVVSDQRFARGAYATRVATSWGELEFSAEQRYEQGARIDLYIDPARVASLDR